HPAPEPGLLQLVELPREVALDRDVRVPEVAARVAAQRGRHRLAVEVEEVLVARAVPAEPGPAVRHGRRGPEKVSSVSNRRLRAPAPPGLDPPLSIQRHSSGSATRRSPSTQRPLRSNRPWRPRLSVTSTGPMSSSAHSYTEPVSACWILRTTLLPPPRGEPGGGRRRQATDRPAAQSGCSLLESESSLPAQQRRQ